MNKKKAESIIKKLDTLYPQADTQLVFHNHFELLVSVMLSAQCTDKRVNTVTAELFKEYNTPENILATSKILVSDYNGEVPGDWEALQKLPGVGRKTANVVASVGFGIPAIAVDTHVFRVSNRIGLTQAKDELHTELQLQKLIPEEEWLKVHHLIIWHGRYCCDSRKPKCETCLLAEDCAYYAHLPKAK